MISAGLDIDRILHFVFYDKILQICGQHWGRKFYRHIFPKYRQIPKKWWGGGGGVTPPPTHTHTQALARHAHVFSCEFCIISKNTFSYKAPPVAASDIRNKVKKSSKIGQNQKKFDIHFCLLFHCYSRVLFLGGGLGTVSSQFGDFPNF